MKPHFIQCRYPGILKSGYEHKNNPVNLNLVAAISELNHSSYGIGFANSNGEYFQKWLYHSQQERDEDYQTILSLL